MKKILADLNFGHVEMLTYPTMEKYTCKISEPYDDNVGSIAAYGESERCFSAQHLLLYCSTTGILAANNMSSFRYGKFMVQPDSLYDSAGSECVNSCAPMGWEAWTTPARYWHIDNDLNNDFQCIKTIQIEKGHNSEKAKGVIGFGGWIEIDSAHTVATFHFIKMTEEGPSSTYGYKWQEVASNFDTADYDLVSASWSIHDKIGLDFCE
jgi:hypothetical protein